MNGAKLIRFAVLACSVVGVSVTQAGSCSAPPSGSGGAWFRSYQQWCSVCGGTPSANASPAMCTPGPNWGGTGPGRGYTSREQAALGLANMGGQLLGQALAGMIFGSPQNEALRRMEAEAARQRAEEERLVREAEMEARKQQLLSEMQGLDRSPDLTLMLDSSTDQLSFMLGDDPLPTRAQPKAEPVAYQLNRAAYLSQQAWQAQTPEQAAELADAAFDAAVGGTVDTAKVPSQAVTAPVDGSLEQQFKELRERYFKIRNEAYPKAERWLQLEEQRTLAATVLADTQQKLDALQRAGGAGDQAARLRTLRDEAAEAEKQLAEQIARARRDARQSQQAVIDHGQALREFLAAPPNIKSPQQAPADERMKNHPFYKGYMDGIQCCSSNAGSFCAGLSGERQQRCLDDYRAGYRKGEKIEQDMIVQAAELGRQDRSAGRRHAAFANPNAVGPCRITWIEAYTDGYQGANPAVFR